MSTSGGLLAATGCLLAALTACNEPSKTVVRPDADRGWFETSVQGYYVRSDRSRVPPAATAVLASARQVYEELFGVGDPDGLAIHLVQDPENPDYRSDFFDHETLEIWLRWWEDDVPFSEWLLGHELAHAYQFAARPSAYREEPSWIHEGWAEHAVAALLAAKDPEAARNYLRSQGESFLQRGADFDRVFHDVYSFPWRRAYPACHLAVHLLVQRQGEAAVMEYFTVHGQAPEATFERFFGAPVAAFGGAIRELAEKLSEAD